MRHGRAAAPTARRRPTARSAAPAPGRRAVASASRTASRLAVPQRRCPGEPGSVAVQLAQRGELDVRLQPVTLLRTPRGEGGPLLLVQRRRVLETLGGLVLTADQRGVARHRGRRVVRRVALLVRRHQRQHLPDRTARGGEEVDEPVGLVAELAGPRARRGRRQGGHVQQDPGPAYVERAPCSVMWTLSSARSVRQRRFIEPETSGSHGRSASSAMRLSSAAATSSGHGAVRRVSMSMCRKISSITKLTRWCDSSSR